MYNEFDPKHYKGKCPCTTKTLYNEKTLIGRLHQHFLSEITEKSLNVFYYACSYAKVDYSRFMNTTVRITLKLIPVWP